MQRVFLCTLFSLLVFKLAAQESLFSLHFQVDQTIAVHEVIHQSTFLEPFPDGIQINGLAISGDVLFNSDSSFIRVILVDDHYKEYLVFESYPLLADSPSFSIHQFGEETSLLKEVVPSSIRFELVDASLFLEELVTSRGDAKKSGISKAELRRQQMLEKISTINENLQNRNIPWIAGETFLASMSYAEKRSYFGGELPRLNGFEYYTGGIFMTPGGMRTVEEIESGTISGAAVESPYVKEFSWRNVHGEDWVTSVKNQAGCNSCWAFGATASVELMVNLHFNQHIDYDLSEQHVISCTHGDCVLGAPQSQALEFAQNTGIVLEECFPYAGSSLDCSGICDHPGERVRIDSFSFFHKEEDKKRAILRGPGSVTVNQWQHVLQVVGYKTLEEGDSLYIKNEADSSRWMTIDDGHPLLNQTTWLCKNSWGRDWGDEGFVYLFGDEQELMMYSIYGPVHSQVFDKSMVSCTDKDGDGYYTWGIGPKPDHCPKGEAEPDGDDSDPCLGPRDAYGNFTSTTPPPEAGDTVVIEGQVVPDLMADGSNIRWYSDKKLSNPIHQGSLFPTGIDEYGDYIFYVTQTVSGCESTANAVTLSIWEEIPSPSGQDTLIKKGEPALLSVHGKTGAIFNWYSDSLLTQWLFTGEIYPTNRVDTGTYTYFVTQTVCQNESEADKVILRIRDLVSIPDKAFLEVLIREGVDTNNDGIITYAEAEAVTDLEVFRVVTDMTGIEAFIHLDTLRCTENLITHLDVSNCTRLKYLDCNSNRLMTLNISSCETLEYLDCSGNFYLKRLDVAACKSLEYLDCSGLLINSLDVANCKALKRLICGSNQLTNLDVSACTALSTLDCSSTLLTRLDVSGLRALDSLDCSRSQLEVLNASGCANLQYLDCRYSQLTSLDVSACGSLEYLDCLINDLSSLDVSDCISLKELNCSRNQLTRLNITGCSSLRNLSCYDNQLTSLYASDCVALQHLDCSENHLTRLDVSGHEALQFLQCSSNQLGFLGVSDCNALERITCSENQLLTLNVSGCSKLERLSCNKNQLISLNASACTSLKYIMCSDNQLTQLELSNCTSLVVLSCNNNNLNSIDLESFPSLSGLFCQANRFTRLKLPESGNLFSLNCYGNQIQSLDVSACSSLKFLNCGANLLEYLDLSNNPELGSMLSEYRELSLADMPSLREVCVWTLPFPPAGVNVDTSGSPKVKFTNCSMEVPDPEPTEFRIYPNPSSGQFTIETIRADSYLIEVFAPHGQRIFQESCHGFVHQIDLSGFPAGGYLISLRHQNSKTLKRVIKL